jgi:hypothetical protein
MIRSKKYLFTWISLPTKSYDTKGIPGQVMPKFCTLGHVMPC